MEQITLGQIAVAVTFIVGLLSGIGYLRKHLKEWITKPLKEQLDPLNNKINELHQHIADVDLESCKNFLVTFLSEIDKGDRVDEIERERFWEQYQHYEKMGGNSYIKRKVEQLKTEGKL